MRVRVSDYPKDETILPMAVGEGVAALVAKYIEDDMVAMPTEILYAMLGAAMRTGHVNGRREVGGI